MLYLICRQKLNFAANSDPMEPYTLALVAVLSAVVLLYLYFGFAVRSRFLNRFDRTLAFLMTKVAGFVMFGVIPFILFNYMAGLTLSETGFSAGRLSQYMFLSVFMVVLIVMMTWFIAGRKKSQPQSGTDNLHSLPPSSLSVVITGWIIYLLGYEYLFRGILWFICYGAFGFYPALVINVIIYFVAHFGQDRRILIGSVPFGVILCLGAHLSGTFLLPFILHGALAVSYEYFGSYYRPGVKVTI